MSVLEISNKKERRAQDSYEDYNQITEEMSDKRKAHIMENKENSKGTPRSS